MKKKSDESDVKAVVESDQKHNENVKKKAAHRREQEDRKIKEH